MIGSIDDITHANATPNEQKQYTLAHALPELVAVVINLIFNLPYGLTSLMILRCAPHTKNRLSFSTKRASTLTPNVHPSPHDSIDMLTEIGPAVSFAWEPAEANVMERPPRNRNTDRLVRPALLAYAYLQVSCVVWIFVCSPYVYLQHQSLHALQAGVIETVFCLAAYFFVLLNNGLGFGDLTHPERVSPKLATMAATAYYVTLILSQVRLARWELCTWLDQHYTPD